MSVPAGDHEQARTKTESERRLVLGGQPLSITVGLLVASNMVILLFSIYTWSRFQSLRELRDSLND